MPFIGIEYNVGLREKPVGWVGASREDLRGFPDLARRRAGHELHQVQKGLMPSDWKPIPGVGPGACEIRISTAEHGANLEHRVFFVAKFKEAVWVLHAFQKTTQKTSRHAIEIGRRRYAEMLRDRQKLEALHGE